MKDKIKLNKRIPGAERRRQILDVASSLFALNGCYSVTVKMISQRCGISDAVLYKHFKSKNDLFSEVIKDKIHTFRINDFLNSLDPDQSTESLLSAVAHQILRLANEDPETTCLLLYSALYGTLESKNLFRAWRQPYVDYLAKQFEERKKKGLINESDPGITARTFVGMVMDCTVSCQLWCEFGYEDFDAEETVANNTRIFARGLAPNVPGGVKH